MGGWSHRAGLGCRIATVPPLRSGGQEKAAEKSAMSMFSLVSSGWVRLNGCHGPSTSVGMTEKAVAQGLAGIRGRESAAGLSSRPERPAFSCARFLSAGRVVEGSWQGCNVAQVDGTKPRLQRGNSSLRSRNLGFIPRINASFFSRRHRLICFSRLMALRTSPKGSK